ncbi:MAG: hypothetical protein QOI38_1833 [Sphingomonadales bacterium]|nr:hypothetical protein [Sphingomonadales bacterium]
MNQFECSSAKPWGIHPRVRNAEDCPRCGWTAPGPRGDARAGAAAGHAWAVIHGGALQAAASEPETRAA